MHKVASCNMPNAPPTSSRHPSGSAKPPPPREQSTYILRMQTCPKLLLVVGCGRQKQSGKGGQVARRTEGWSQCPEAVSC